MNYVLDRRQNDLTVILENVNDPHNIAAVLRTCDAVGIMEIFVLNTTVNTYKHFDDRKSSSANKWMIVHQYTNIAECFEHVRKQYQTIYSTHLDEKTKDLYFVRHISFHARTFSDSCGKSIGLFFPQKK